MNTLEQRGINTISEAMQRMTANNAGTITNNWNVGFNFATGATAPALRGLTVQSTLSIADGLRIAPYPLADDGQRNFVDLNTIPNAVTERIEVLRDGASSTYGADAIAGVVNVITKKEIQGLHITGSGGFSQEGGGEEQRFDVVWGTGDLGNDGFNFYVAGEYLNMENLKRSERDAPFNTSDWSTQCGPSGSCMPNNNWNGITQEDGSWFGWISDTPGVAYIREIDVNTGAGIGQYQFANPADGCRNWPEVQVPVANQNGVNPDIACEVNYWGATGELQPEIERMGLTMRFTANFGDDEEFYAMTNFYRTDTFSDFVGVQFDRGTTPPQGLNYQGTYQAILPVYVCPQGVGTLDGLNTGCNAQNGQLNPYNPWAANGNLATVEYRMEREREIDTVARTSRVALGLNGSFGNDWRYNTSYTFSEVNLTRTQSNYLIPQRVADVLAQGTFNINNPTETPEAIFDYIAPDQETVSPSRLWQIDANVAKDVAELGGGPLQVAVGAQYRDESINAPSANPANDTNPYDRYVGINSVGTAGSRDVTSAYFEIDAPLTEIFDVVASGRYDDYSTGQSNFSPKVGFKLSPLETLSLRGTWSEGFRIPSFNEAFGLPTTGYVTRTVDCVQFAAWCASHGNNNYATGSYSLGLTQTGDPTLDPEESESITLGVIWNATENLTITLDYWQIEVDNLIAGVTDTSAAEAQYYANNGVVTIPGITAVPGNPDANFPNALPLLGFIQSAYQNQDSQEVNGFDLGVEWNSDIGNAGFSSRLDASLLTEYTLTTDDGTKLEYEGTLSPCNITSCSGTPELRASWQNTFFFNDDRTTASLTIYFTEGLDSASVDFGGVPGDCAGNAAIGASTHTYLDGTPVDCHSEDIWNADLTASHQLTDQIRLFVDILNVFDIEPDFDPSAAYALYGFNPAWAGPNIMGRYFRLGANFDFE